MRWALVVLLLAASSTFAQPNGILLIAKPGMPDPNFSETVVLVAWAEDYSTVGVILNRPSVQSLVDIAPNWPGAADFKQQIYSGGPVMRQVLVALFESTDQPKARAFRVLPKVYMSMHPENLEPLLARPPERMRLYAGFSGWAPRQLESEVDRGTWYMVRATEDVIFRKDTTGMWRELVEKAQGSRTFLDSDTRFAARAPLDILGP